MATDPDQAWAIVQDAILAFGSEVPDIAKARAALLTVLSEEAWTSYLPPIGKRCEYDEFGQWVKERVPRGLDTTVENLLTIAEGDTRLKDALDKVLQRPAHVHADVDNIHVRPTGTSESAALRRLRKDAPELHADVLAGRISAHGAMVKAGFRRRTGTVRYDDPASAARTLRKHMPREALLRLAELLTKEG